VRRGAQARLGFDRPAVDHAQAHETQRSRVFDLLSDLQWHTFAELARVGGIRYGARLLELKRLGFEFADREYRDGKEYRLVSLTQGFGQRKRVKVFLEPEDVRAMLGLSLTTAARAALADALGSFTANKEKL